MIIVTKFLRFCCRQATVGEDSSRADETLRSNLRDITDDMIEHVVAAVDWHKADMPTALLDGGH